MKEHQTISKKIELINKLIFVEHILKSMYRRDFKKLKKINFKNVCLDFNKFCIKINFISSIVI